MLFPDHALGSRIEPAELARETSCEVDTVPARPTPASEETTVCAITVPTPALEAARAALTIAASYESSEPIVLTRVDYEDPRAALDAALVAGQFEGLSYCTVTVPATHDIHGTRLAADALIPPAAGDFLTVVVELKTASPLDAAAQTPVIEYLRCEVEQLAEESGAFVSQVTYVID